MPWEQLVVLNPKRHVSTPLGRDKWFPYYAGYSGEFAREIFRTSGLPSTAFCMDPWNGSGTTTAAACLSKYRAVGFDLNPVMIVVSKARLLPRIELPSVNPLLADIIEKSSRIPFVPESSDPFRTWFVRDAAAALRSIERTVYKLLVSAESDSIACTEVAQFSAMAALFYVALFRTVRNLLRGFTHSNPTWIKRPTSSHARLRPIAAKILHTFQQNVISMSASALDEPNNWDFADADVTIAVAGSNKLPVKDASVDFVLTSPPYCTRIDYAVATSPELATLGLDFDSELKQLRSQLIGTPTISSGASTAETSWGPTCNSFLQKVQSHPSKAAKSYYYKTYVQYFSGINESLREISRCIKPGGRCILVVQDSHFKDVRADLPSIFTEIGQKYQLSLGRRDDFPMSRTLVNINTRSRRYRDDSSAIESALCFNKN